MNNPSDLKVASDRSAEVVMNAPNIPWGKRRVCRGVSEGTVAGAAVLAEVCKGRPRSGKRRRRLGEESTHRAEREPERRRLGLWWLRQVSTPDGSEA